jgi:hypothetical protein
MANAFPWTLAAFPRWFIMANEAAQPAMMMRASANFFISGLAESDRSGKAWPGTFPASLIPLIELLLTIYTIF